MLLGRPCQYMSGAYLQHVPLAINIQLVQDKVDAMLKEPIFQKYPTTPGPLMRGLVSCTGSQFCGLALIETKNRAIGLVQQLEAELDIPKTVRIHWTGCPNSCGQAQVRSARSCA